MQTLHRFRFQHPRIEGCLFVVLAEIAVVVIWLVVRSAVWHIFPPWLRNLPVTAPPPRVWNAHPRLSQVVDSYLSPERIRLGKLGWRSRPKVCLNILSESRASCERFVESNSDMLFSPLGFPADDDFLLRCVLDDSDDVRECDQESGVPCMRLRGARYSYESLPSKVTHGFAMLASVVTECRWVVKADADISLTRPLSEILALPKLAECESSCYFGHIVNGWSQKGPGERLHDPFWRSRMETDELPPYAWGGCYGVSGDLIPYFWWLFETEWFVGRGLEDVWKGVEMLAAGATFVPLGRFWKP